MLKNLDALLFYSVKIIDKDGGQILNRALKNHIKYLEKLGVEKAEDKINSLFEEEKYNYVNDEMLADDQRHSFATAHNTIIFAEAISVKNVQNDDQKDVVLKLNNVVAKAFEGDVEMQTYIENINSRVKNGECINLYEINCELIDIIHNKIKSDISLQSEIAQLMVDNFEILLNNKIECKAEFIEFLNENEEIISSKMIREEVQQKVVQMKSIFNPTQESRIEMITKPVNAMKSFIARIGCQRRSKQPWTEKIINEEQISIQNLS